MMMVLQLAVLAVVLGQAFTHPLTFNKNLNIVCPGSAEECPDGNTCCSRGGGAYSCCPKLHAVCCEDKKHCCPEGYTCSTTASQCLKAGLSHPLIEMTNRERTVQSLIKLASRPGKDALYHPVVGVGNHTCPDKTDVCPDSDTCCPIEGGKEGCCPHVKAVCCPDMKHCCPEGFTCGSTAKKCTMGELDLPLVQLTNRLQKQEDIICPDHKSECPSGNTCCKVGSNYACCPKENGVCCSDEKHCCPQGYKCGKTICDPEVSSHPLVALSIRQEKQEVLVCPDGRSTCPNGDTCCPFGGGKEGCCPREHAVCCPDHKHCCPGGYTCDSANKGVCLKGDTSHPIIELSIQDDIICPNTLDRCPADSTCCLLDSGSYGCCPEEHAVCCRHGKVCCPMGYTCNDEFDGCLLKNIPFLKTAV